VRRVCLGCAKHDGCKQGHWLMPELRYCATTHTYVSMQVLGLSKASLRVGCAPCCWAGCVCLWHGICSRAHTLVTAAGLVAASRTFNCTAECHCQKHGSYAAHNTPVNIAAPLCCSCVGVVCVAWQGTAACLATAATTSSLSRQQILVLALCWRLQLQRNGC
jgi:hypothetical protein